jgi:hypothetical protein
MNSRHALRSLISGALVAIAAAASASAQGTFDMPAGAQYAKILVARANRLVRASEGTILVQ